MEQARCSSCSPANTLTALTSKQLPTCWTLCFMHWLRYSIYELQIKRTNAGRIMMIFERVCRRHAGVQMTRCCCLRRPMSRWSTWSCSTRATCLLRQMSAPFVGLSQQCRSSTSRRSTDSWKTRRVYGKCHEKHPLVFSLTWYVRTDTEGQDGRE